MTFKPLLASPVDLDNLTFPLIASPKIDGIRCLLHPELGPVTRTLKPIPNRHVREALMTEPAFLDGELLTFDAGGDDDDFNTVQSKIMSEDGEPTFLLYAFDHFAEPERAYTDRLARLLDTVSPGSVYTQVLEYRTVHDLDDIMAAEAEYVTDGYEGLMLRSLDGRYKFGRSTAREQILTKLKRFDDDEAVIVGAIEKMHNANAAVTNALGHTERSGHKANLMPAGTLGALSVRWKGVHFEIGTGFDDATRAYLWLHRDAIVGKTVTFKYQGVGSQGAPRFPVFLGLRRDLEVAA